MFHSRVGNRLALQYPVFEWGGILVICSIAFFRRKQASRTALSFQFGKFFSSSSKTIILLRSKRGLYLLLILSCFILLSHPQRVHQTIDETKKGIDILLALDISYSMEANDFQPNRLEAAKTALQNFLQTRTSDRVGLVVFAGKPFTSIPLTFDYHIF